MRLDFFLIRIIVVEISHGLIFVLVPLEFRRGTACYFFKISVEFLYGIVAYVRGDFLYRVVGVRNELLRVSYPYANNKTITLNNVNHKNKVLTIKKGAIIYYNNVAVVLSETFNKKWDGTSWTDVADISVPSEKTSMTAAYRWGNASVLQINTGLPSDTPLKSFLATDNGSEINQSGNQNFGWAGMAADSGIIVITFNFNTAFSAGQSFGLAKGSVFGFTNGKKSGYMFVNYTDPSKNVGNKIRVCGRFSKISVVSEFGQKRTYETNGRCETELPAGGGIFVITDNL